MMGRCTSFDSNQARLQLGEEHPDLSSAKLAAENPLTFSAHAIGMKDVLRDIETYCDRLHHWMLLHLFPENLIGLRLGGCRPQYQLRTSTVEEEPVT